MFNRKSATRLFTITVAVVALATGGATAQSELPTYSIVEIGTFGTPGSDAWSDARSINANGDVVGTAEKDVIVEAPDGTFGDFQLHAFLYRDGELIDLGNLDERNPVAYAEDINDAGNVAGWSSAWSEDPRLPTWFDRPFGMTPGGTMVDPASGGGFVKGRATAINNSGQFALNLMVPDPPPAFRVRAHFWDPEGGATEIRFDDGPPPGSFDSASFAWNINDAGVVVGDAPRADGWPHAFKYDSATGIIEDLHIYPALQSGAFGVNDHGDVAGWIEGFTGQYAIVWKDDGSLVAFPYPVDPQTFHGRADAINDHGDVIGTDVGYISVPWVSFDVLGQQWPEKIALADLLTEEDRAAWELRAARDINAAGQIVGLGVKDGKFRGFVMSPDPAAGNAGEMSPDPARLQRGTANRGERPLLPPVRDRMFGPRQVPTNGPCAGDDSDAARCGTRRLDLRIGD